MGRRSTHTPDQLRDLILDAAQSIIENSGLAGLSAREIARMIEYSPGTIYNMFANLDDVIVHVEGRVLDSLGAKLAGIARSQGKDAPLRLANAYLASAHEKPRLWNLLFEHHLPNDAKLPAWYKEKLDNLVTLFDAALGQCVTQADAARRLSAHSLWAGVHGITSLSTTGKLSSISRETAESLVGNLVGTYLAGLAAIQVAPPPPGAN